ncbi:MAG TPA: MFS transporter [Thermoanaerobaculia bacterium]|jgi:EmrB/QacA subfamily drug resistance transporter|nr:MFS transporter [Thermoanaerobaculia bacterium]
MNRTQRFTLAATGLGLFMIFLDALIVNVALPSIQTDFQVGESGLQWVVTAYSLGMAVAIMSAGTLADMYGRRRLYFTGIALFTASSVACGMAHSLDVLNAARAIQGVAAATVNVTSLALVSAGFPDPKQKAWAIGIWTAIASTAMAIGPTLGGFLVQHSSWRIIFLVNVPVGLAVLALTWRFVEESRDERPRRFDVPGQLLFVAAVGAFAYAVIEGPRSGWLSAEILALFGVAVAALAAFVAVERASADPMMDLTLFRDRTYALAIVTIFTVLFAVYGMLLVITQYLQNVRGFSPTQAGLLLLPYSATCTLVSLRAGHLMGVVGSRRLILLGLASQVLGFGVLIAGLGQSTPVVVVGLVLSSLGSALCLTPITSLAMTAVPPERAGMASGIMSAQRALGSTVGFAVLGSVLAASLTATLGAHLASAIPDPVERREVAARIIGDANPRAYAAEIGPGRPIHHMDPATEAAILAAADRDFVEGIRLSLGSAIVLLGLVLAAGLAWFPRGKGGLADATREEKTLQSEESSRAGPEGAGLA